MLSCYDLGLKINDETVFAGLGFSLAPSSILAIRGNAGVGKSKLLATLAGLIKPDQGVVSYNDVPVLDVLTAYATLVQYVGFQDAVKPELTVEENIAFWSLLKGSSELVPAALAYFELEDKKDQLSHSLSPDWQHRIALARLIACQSKVWILDDPFTRLDEDGKRLLLNLISVRSNEGGTVILSSFDPLPLPKAIELDIAMFQPSKEVV